MDQRPHVVIIGGGFGGLRATHALRKADVRVTLVDRSNYHTFQPLLYQVATAGLNPGDIAAPIRRIFRGQKNLEVILADVERIEPATKTVVLADGSLKYDYLILAAGSVDAYLGHDEWREFAPGLKSVDNALENRRRILYAFEAAERETDPARKAAWMTFVLVGGGPTGVEMSGAIVEIAHHALAKDFHNIDPKQARVILLEGGDRVLPSYDPSLSESAKKQLERLGVEVRVNAKVTKIDRDGVEFGDERIATKTALWSAGVCASPLTKGLGAPTDKKGRIKVNPDLTVPGHDEIYAVGDLITMEQDGKPLPGVAQGAIQTGEHAAANLLKTLAGKPREPFHYWNKGELSTIGRASAVGEIGKLKISGLIAWVAWLTVHLFFLIGFRNRLAVMFSWAFSYITYDRGARLITGHLPTDIKESPHNQVSNHPTPATAAAG